MRLFYFKLVCRWRMGVSRTSSYRSADVPSTHRRQCFFGTLICTLSLSLATASESLMDSGS